jgi:peptide/nickel transport system substrate-binding protein
MDMPEPQRVVFLESGGEESRAQLMATNQMDAAQNLSVGTFEAIRAQNPNTIAWFADYPYAVADPCARQLEINTTVAPWDNANMRRAVAHIIDRTQIVNIAAEGATTRRRAPCSRNTAPWRPSSTRWSRRATACRRRRTWKAGQALIEAEGWVRDGDYYRRTARRWRSRST